MLQEFQQLKRQIFHQTAQSVSVLHGRIKIFQRTSSFDHPDRQRALHCTCGRSSRRLREPEAECVRSAAQQQHASTPPTKHGGILGFFVSYSDRRRHQQKKSPPVGIGNPQVVNHNGPTCPHHHQREFSIGEMW